ncbi:Amidinotransferase [Aliiroseovarius crassostreae]|nr:Amidinotransferase [Aliiroseovarius crassostreae]
MIALQVLSARALKARRPDPIAIIEQSATPLPLSIPTIETAGGSVRCMIAGIHLARR